MCGINGILGLEALDRPRDIIGRMNDRLAHRGPDADGVFISEDIVLGHRRLSVIDLNEVSDQPFREQSGRYTLVFNGEVYNYREIRSQLADHPFLTSGDTEVVLAAYMAWGPACLQRFNGMFALAIWDEERKELFLARDRGGIKPLYISFLDDHLVFSSELRALLASGVVPKKIRRKSVVDFLRYQTVQGPDTMVEGVEMLPAGHYLKVQDNEHSLERYWIPGALSNSTAKSPEQVHRHIRQTLSEAVHRRTISDVPYGAFLSGGIDSSAIVGLMSEGSDTQIATFSVSFAEEEFSEAPYARMVADRFRTAHHDIRLDPRDFLEQLPSALRAMDHPSGDGPNTFVVSKATKEAGITVALSGLGGDELFAGYELFKRCAEVDGKRWLTSYPKFMRRMVGSALVVMRPGMSSRKTKELLTMDSMALGHTYPMMRRLLLDREIDALIPNGSSQLDPVALLAAKMEKEHRDLPFLSRISLLEMQTYMQHVLLRDTDQMSMAHALEVRVPFLDHELIDLVLGVSDQMKYPHSPKKLLIDSLDGLLPKEIIDRPKMGFTLPWEDWMRGELFELCDTAIRSLQDRGLMDASALGALWKDFLAGHADLTWSRIWPFVVLEKWIEENGIET